MNNFSDRHVTANNLIGGNHNVIINNRDKPYNTYNSSVISGSFNPIYREINTKLLNIDTKFRDKTISKSKSTHYILTLPTPIKNVISMRLAAAEIPNSSYLFNKNHGTNSFKIIIDDEHHTITVPDGNYTAEELINYLETQMKYLKR